jgi:mannose-6-phosphate isomerase-like protein (cupin superfamily)
MIDRKTAEHYFWGGVCEGWHFVKEDALSVIEERIPSGGAELRHHHQYARQFFYVLSGTLSFEVGGREFDLTSRQGIYIRPGIPHRVFNRSAGDAEFLVISAPPSHSDRTLE